MGTTEEGLRVYTVLHFTDGLNARPYRATSSASATALCRQLERRGGVAVMVQDHILARVHKPGTQDDGVYYLYADGTYAAYAGPAPDNLPTAEKPGPIGNPLILYAARKYTPASGWNVWD